MNKRVYCIGETRIPQAVVSDSDPHGLVQVLCEVAVQWLHGMANFIGSSIMSSFPDHSTSGT